MRILALTISAALLTGCAAAEPEPTVNPNEAACEAFEAVTQEVAQRIVDDAWEESDKTYFAGQFDEISLAAEGDVENRVDGLIADLPDPIWMLFLDHEAYFENVRSVSRACEAEGIAIDPSIWQ